jgi:hypothetical protein
MATSTALRPSVREALRELIDYAGLFPPAELALDSAVREYEEARAGPYAWMLGRFIIPASQLPLTATFGAQFSVIVEPNVDALNRLAATRDRRIVVSAIEIPLEKSLTPFRETLSADEILNVLGALEADLALANLRDIPAFIEIPRGPPWRGMLAETVAALARLELHAKLRCGGVTAGAFPSVDQVAEFIVTAAAANVSFKATAGLHHPVRHRDDATGFMMHGFLNLLAAAALAPRADRETLRRVIAEEDPSAFKFDDESLSWRDQHVSVAQLQQMRRDAFIAYGSCSFSEPVDDLTALGVLPAQ